ncbi:MAG: 2-hydroxychromene-2-carboxylate isomerase [Betaproteobacteria bacterium]|nr:2-hydroxychromene-2-carboxylate isomerase [Betaproteobacteria bacterium]
MSKSVDYYLTPTSPWTYLGHARFADMAQRHGATVAVKPVDYGVIFPQSGGLPLGKRAPQRQAYRLMELARWRDFLGLPLNLQPKFFPADSLAAACLICAAPPEKKMALAGDCLRAVWAEEMNIADRGVLSEIAARHGMADADGAIVEGKLIFERNTQEALLRQVFGAPTFAVGDELFWGQDRLDFLDRALAQ